MSIIHANNLWFPGSFYNYTGLGFLAIVFGDFIPNFLYKSFTFLTASCGMIVPANTLHFWFLKSWNALAGFSEVSLSSSWSFFAITDATNAMSK